MPSEFKSVTDALTEKLPARKVPSAAADPHQRDHQHGHGDRGDVDDNDPPLLEPYLRFRDLVAAQVVGNWTQLARLIDEHGFPAGVLLSPNARAWRLDEVSAWLDARPTARKISAPATKPRGRKPSRRS